MKTMLAVFVMALMLLAAHTSPAKETVVLANIEYPPYSSQTLLNGGITSELIVEAFKTQGYEVQFVWLPWARALKQTKEGKYDGLCQSWYRKEREKWFIFSKHYASSEVVFFKRRDFHITFSGDYDVVRPYKIGIVRGYVNPPKFDEIKDTLNIEESSKDIINLQKLYKNRVQLVVIDKNVALYILGSSLKAYSDMLEPVGPFLKIDPLHIMFSKKAKGVEKIVEAFTTGMNVIETNGTQKRILEKHVKYCSIILQ